MVRIGGDGGVLDSPRGDVLMGVEVGDPREIKSGLRSKTVSPMSHYISSKGY